jgi:hypothetical protein
MGGNLPVPSHRAAHGAALLSFPLLGFTEYLSMQCMEGDSTQVRRPGKAGPTGHAG